MSEPIQFIFNHKEVVTALLKHQGIHEGIWGITIRFRTHGSNMGATSNDLLPVLINVIDGIGLCRNTKESNITVDAAVVNPKPSNSVGTTAHSDITLQ